MPLQQPVSTFLLYNRLHLDDLSIWPDIASLMPIYFIVMTIFVIVSGVSGESIGRRKAVPVLYVQGTHYEVGFDIVSTYVTITHKPIN